MSGTCADSRPSARPPADGRRLLLRALHLVCRYALAAVFLIAALSKITDLAGFEDFLTLHTHLPYPIAWATAHYLPWLELTCGLCLALGYAVREAALLTGLLLALFLAFALTAPIETDCHCLVFPGGSSTFSLHRLLVRNALLLAASVFLAWRRSPAQVSEKIPSRQC